MKQLLLFIFLLIYSLNSFGQENKTGCSKISSHIFSSGIHSTILPLENPEDFEKDSIIFQFPDSLKEEGNYIYLINRTKESLFFRLSPYYRIPDVTQEILDKNGNWLEIEYVPCPGNCMPSATDYIKTNHYITFTKQFYKKGNFCTKIRFKVIGSLQDYYSQPYDGCVDSCLLNPYKEKISCGLPISPILSSPRSRLLKIYKYADLSNAEKMKWVKENWDEDHEKVFTQVTLSLYRKMKDYENAFFYAERLVKIDPNSGRGYLYKGDFYIAGTRECFPEPESIWIQQLSIHLALEEWNKAKKFSDSKEEAEKRINRYTHYAFQSEGCIGPGGGLNPNKTFHIACWINRTVKYK